MRRFAHAVGFEDHMRDTDRGAWFGHGNLLDELPVASASEYPALTFGSGSANVRAKVFIISNATVESAFTSA